jgi:hypothetical protein
MVSCERLAARDLEKLPAALPARRYLDGLRRCSNDTAGDFYGCSRQHLRRHRASQVSAIPASPSRSVLCVWVAQHRAAWRGAAVGSRLCYERKMDYAQNDQCGQACFLADVCMVHDYYGLCTKQAERRRAIGRCGARCAVDRQGSAWAKRRAPAWGEQAGGLASRRPPA